ncbi:unnamed protein product [Sympodiomycopsis kandeliae]
MHESAAGRTEDEVRSALDSAESSSAQGQLASSDQDARGTTPPPRPSPWGTPAKQQNGSKSSPWGTKTAAVSRNDMGSFPSLSASKGTPKRHRHSPWHQNASINPYPPRSQEIAHRWLARDGNQEEEHPTSFASSAGSSSGRKGIFSLRDIDTPPDLRSAIGTEAEDTDFYNGPVQMYGMSRVTVRDLSDPSLKGKNKIRRQDMSTNGPQIYGRFYQPHVQKGKRPRAAVQAESQGQHMLTGDEEEYDHISEMQSDGDTSMLDESGTQGALGHQESLADVIRELQREQRLQAANERMQAASSSSSSLTAQLDPFKRLHVILMGAMQSPEAVCRAQWLHPSERNAMLAALSSLPLEAEDKVQHDLQRNILRFAAQVRQGSFTEAKLLALLRILDFCVLMQYHMDSNDAFSSSLRSLDFVCHESPEHAQSALLSYDRPATNRNVLALVDHTNMLLEQHRFSAAELYSRRILTACQVLQFFHSAIWARKFLSSSAFYLADLAQIFHSDLVTIGPLSSPSFAFLYPMPMKSRLRQNQVEEYKNAARKQGLWSSFYSPNASTATTSEASLTTLAIDRNDLLRSSIEQLSQLKDWQFHQDLRVKFIGDGEEGVDSVLGGVRKEWVSLLRKEFYETGLIRECKDRPEMAIITPNADVDSIWCLGVLMALCIFHRIPLGLSLPDYVIAAAFGVETPISSAESQHLEDDKLEQNLTNLGQYEPRLAASLREMLSWVPPQGTSISSKEAEALFEQTFSLNFVVTMPNNNGDDSHTTISLCKGGQQRHVKLDNRLEYASTLTRYLLYDSIAPQLDALYDGIATIWNSESVLESFSADEVRLMIHGDPAPIRLHLIKEHVETVGKRSRDDKERMEDDELLDWFWKVVPLLTEKDVDGEEDTFPRSLLSYITSSSHLSDSVSSSHGPIFRIHLVTLPPWTVDMPVAPLPWTSTCTVTLFLPRQVYRNAEHLKERLDTALKLSEGVGFGLK